VRAADPTALLDALRVPPGWTLDIDPMQLM
jgi:hypothetical protein